MQKYDKIVNMLILKEDTMKRRDLKFIAIITAVIMSISLAGCSAPVVETAPQADDPKPVLTVAALKGPTGMGMAKLMDDEAKDDTDIDYEFSMLDAPDELVGKIINKEVDIAALPTNLALTLYNKTKGEVQLLAVNALGSVYVLENGSQINEVDDLKGRTISSSGKGATPDFIMQYILSENGMDSQQDVQIDFTLSHSELAAAVVSGDVDIAVLPEPFVTTVMSKNKDIRVALDLSKEYSELSDEASVLPMACIVVQRSVAEDNKELVDTFLKSYQESVEFVNENHDEASQMIADQGILPNPQIAKSAIPSSNIVYIDAADAREDLEKYYGILFDFEPKAIGGMMADEGFYYAR